MEGATENMLNFTDLTLAALLIICFFVVALDHGNDLVNVVAGNHHITHSLLGLHATLHHKFVLLLLIDDTFADGLCWVFLVVLPQIFSELEQFTILLEGLETFVRV